MPGPQHQMSRPAVPALAGEHVAMTAEVQDISLNLKSLPNQLSRIPRDLADTVLGAALPAAAPTTGMMKRPIVVQRRNALTGSIRAKISERRNVGFPPICGHSLARQSATKGVSMTP